jgi:hypothetical protein
MHEFMKSSLKSLLYNKVHPLALRLLESNDTKCKYIIIVELKLITFG